VSADKPTDKPRLPGQAGPEFAIKAFFDEDQLVGARWWNDSFQAFTSDRRGFMQWGGVAVAVALGGGVATLVGLKSCDDDDDRAIDLDALVLQRKSGWDVGGDKRPLVFDMPVQMDARTDTAYVQHLAGLARDLAPRDPRLQPFAVPTLFQSLAGGPGSDRLAAAVHPIFTIEMKQAHERGAALADLAAAPGAPRDVALVLDLPGPESVAVAAAIAGRFAPVFIFDNWPHPKAVVPAHNTLGAAVYYRPLFLEANQQRPAGAPPVFVLDSARLTPYRDDPTRFDNRYVVNLPSADQLRALGIKRLLYVRPSGTQLQELDDLNADFVGLDRGGISVDALALNDFQRAQLTDGQAPASTSASHAGGYYYGGHPYTHLLFWNRYGWGPAPRLPASRARTSPPPALPARTPYRPTFRPTVFNTRAVGGAAGVGKQKPSGFGRVSVRSPDGGRTVRQVYSGNRRSGSFGRSRSSSYG
jgi:hypothetical protein